MARIGCALVFLCFFLSVCSFTYEGVKLFECESYTRRDCSQIYSNDQHMLLPSTTDKITKELLTNKSGLFDVIGTPGSIKSVEVGSFDGLKKLKRIWLGGQKLKNIYYGVFSGLPIYYLYLSANEIETIESEALDIKQLRKLYLDRNQLTYFEPNWFSPRKLQSLSFLYVSHNKIKSINRKAFFNFPRLTKIDFSFNEIEHISPDIFNHESDLDSFNLKHNKIKTLDPKFLMGVNTIEELNLAYNFLRSINPIILNTTIINSVNVHPNLWKCFCLNKFEAGLLSKNIEPNTKDTLDTYLTCYSSDSDCDSGNHPSDTTKSEAFEKVLMDAYHKAEKTCTSDEGCNEGSICRSNYCWPLISEAYFSVKEENYFFWNFY